MSDYTTTITLNHEEIPAKINKSTGEFTELTKRPNNIPEGKEIFEPNGLFKKSYTESWKFLNQVTTPIEFKAAYALVMKAQMNTNSLEPLNDETTLNELMEILDVSINKVRPILKTLFELGVYGKFEVYDPSKPYTKYWIINPYLSFSGKLVDSDIARLFRGTRIAKAYLDPKTTYIR